jgi:hypothetical protein
MAPLVYGSDELIPYQIGKDVYAQPLVPTHMYVYVGSQTGATRKWLAVGGAWCSRRKCESACERTVMCSAMIGRERQRELTAAVAAQ